MFQIDEIKPKIKKIAKRHKFSLVLLFGSQATGKTHANSDVDIAFVSEKYLRPSDAAKIQFEISQKLKIKNLELVDLKNATPLLLNQIAKKSVLLYEKEQSVFASFKIYGFKRFMEAKDLLKLRDLSLDKFIQKI
ncbi:MAG: nucleotidyltransferase domain-containing protein [bacterium]